jgi:hypothetical protein
VEGKLWVDKQDFGWIKIDGKVTQSFSMVYSQPAWSAARTSSWSRRVSVTVSGCRNAAKCAQAPESFS